MHVYFVRHGETVLNRSGIHQTAVTPLSPKGWEQARTVAEYLRQMNPDLILTSSHTRALETSRIIGNTLGLTPKTSTLLREIDRPTSLSGKPLVCFKTFWYVIASVLRQKNVLWRFEDAENFNDIYTRVRETVRHLESLSDTHKSVVVVSHNIYINLLVAYMCYNRILAVRDLLPSFFNVRKLKNCSVIPVQKRKVRNTYGTLWDTVR